MTEAEWPSEPRGPEALYRGRRGQKGDQGDQGDQGDKGEPGMTASAFRAFISLLVLILLISSAALVVGAREVSSVRANQAALELALARQHQHTLRLCQFYADLGDLASVPVMVNPVTHQAMKLSIAAIADSREAWRGLGCPGKLTKPGPTYLRWAAYWKLSPR